MSEPRARDWVYAIRDEEELAAQGKRRNKYILDLIEPIPDDTEPVASEEQSADNA